MGLGLVVIKAAEAAKQGASLAEVVSTTSNGLKRAQCMCLFETLEYLQKGGRIGKAQAMLGSLLNVKPMIIVRDGEVHPLGRARTFSKALGKLKETATGFAPLESLAVMHSTTPDLADEVAKELGRLLSSGVRPYVTRFGPALGVYAGPGALGISLPTRASRQQHPFAGPFPQSPQPTPRRPVALHRFSDAVCQAASMR